MSRYRTSPLHRILKRVQESVEIRPEETYKQVTVRLFHKGVILRGQQSGAAIRTTRQWRVRAGQVLLSRIDARNGAIGLVPPELDGAIVTNDFWPFAVDYESAEPRFIDLYFGTNQFVEACQRASEGTTNRVRLQPSRFLQIEVPLPPLDEQRRIAARIEELSAKIQEAHLLRNQALEDAVIFVASLHLELAGGTTVRLDQILALDEDEEPVQYGQKYPQVGVKGFGQGLFARETLDATQTTYRSFNRLYEGALVLSQVKGWEGAIAVCGADLVGRYVSPEYRTFRCISGKAMPRYLAALVATPWFWSRLTNVTRGVGARRERTRPEQFLTMELPMPTGEQQRKAVPILEKLDLVKRLQADTTTELNALLPSILSRAFSGAL